MSEKQTQSFLMRRFDQAGVRPKTKYGQNFLVDLNLLGILLDAGELESRDVVLEVGTGMGSLTTRMASKAGHVITVEIDRDLVAMAEREFAGVSNIEMLQMDALRNKNHLDETLLTRVREALSKRPEGRFKLVANLPYNVATPIISNLLTTDPIPERMVVTIQKELAERIVAPPATKDYSALTIWIQSQCDCEIVRIMPPTVFWPRPKVDSAILRIQPNAQKRSRIDNVDHFHPFVRSLFLHRRKFLRSALISAVQDRLDKPQVDRLLGSLGHGPTARAEELPVEEMIRLANAVRHLEATEGSTNR
ncbi:MAG: 16S rRNA (adenine(1518)-N(6)/adenine(1519)-N(6))-dimethyltransferase RsmA [Pirellulaceae bacterium]